MEPVFALGKDGMYHPSMDMVEAPNSINDLNYDTNLLQSGQLLTSTWTLIIFLNKVKTCLIGLKEEKCQWSTLFGGRKNYMAKEGQMKFMTSNISTKK